MKVINIRQESYDGGVIGVAAAHRRHIASMALATIEGKPLPGRRAWPPYRRGLGNQAALA